MVVRLGSRPARRFLLPGRVPAGTGGMLMSPADRGIDVHLPRDQPRSIGPALQRSQNPGPHALTLPAPEQPIDGLPVPVLNRKIPPRHTSPHAPPHPVDQQTPIANRTPQPRDRQQRLQHRPLLIRKIPTPHPEIITARNGAAGSLPKHGLVAALDGRPARSRPPARGPWPNRATGLRPCCVRSLRNQVGATSGPDEQSATQPFTGPASELDGTRRLTCNFFPVSGRSAKLRLYDECTRRA